MLAVCHLRKCAALGHSSGKGTDSVSQMDADMNDNKTELVRRLLFVNLANMRTEPDEGLSSNGGLWALRAPNLEPKSGKFIVCVKTRSALAIVACCA